MRPKEDRKQGLAPGVYRRKATPEITDVDHASLLLGHTKGDITERVYRRVGARQADQMSKVLGRVLIQSTWSHSQGCSNG